MIHFVKSFTQIYITYTNSRSILSIVFNNIPYIIYYMSAAHMFLKTELVVKSYKIVFRTEIQNSVFKQFRHNKTNGYSTKIINSIRTWL